MPAILFSAAVVSAAIALLLLRSLGSRYRVGRLLAAAPHVEIAEAIELAAGAPRYVRVYGRISSEEEFPDENDRPLVYRHKRVDIADSKGRWRSIADQREAVPFGVETRGEFIAIDESAIAEGLVAIPRESTGTVSDLPRETVTGVDDLPAPDSAARLVIEQVSAVEHATVCGTPVHLNGQPTMTAGAGRPLIVTTLEAPAAMRVLASGQRGRVVTAAGLLVLAVLLLVAAAVAAIAAI
ncbi:MAG TPA: hypothetical protein VH371_02405 [Candidatus Limnocylindrales bacterium]